MFLQQRSKVVIRWPRESQTILDAILSLKCLQFLKDDLQLTFTFSFLVEKCYFFFFFLIFIYLFAPGLYLQHADSLVVACGI